MLQYAPTGLNALGPGDHVCSIYENERQHRDLVGPFLKDGLLRGEKVVYLVDAHEADQVLGYLDDLGLPPGPPLARGQLSVLSAREGYLRDGLFDPREMIRFLEKAADAALAEGYTALRVSGEMSWALRGWPGSERLLEYERSLNNLPRRRILGICQYERGRFDAATLQQVLSAHPVAVIGAEVCDNFYYIPPDTRADEEILSRRLENLAVRKKSDERTSETLAELEAFGASVAHDLRGPLRAMAGHAGILAEKFGYALGGPGREHVRRIEAAARRMDGLLAGLLRYSRVAQEEISLEPVDVDSLLADLLQELDDDLRSTGAALRVLGPLGRLLADKLLLRQALSNLLSNALKYVAPDERPDITLRTEEAGAWARLVVEDRGIGIARGEEERIFRIFERAERSGRYEGSGVGLAIVGKAARRMGGRAGVDSEPGRGSRFWIELPRA